MDATERPIKIPKDFSIYAEKHGIYETFKRLLTTLVVKMPDDPLNFMINFFENLQEVPKILLMGARCSGKSSLAAMLADKLGCEIVIRDEELMETETKSEQKEQEPENDKSQESFVSIPTSLNVKDSSLKGVTNIEEDGVNESVNTPLVEDPFIKWAQPTIEKLRILEEKRCGWVLDGVVKCKEHAMALCNAGYFPTHTVILDAPANVLVARGMKVIGELMLKPEEDLKISSKSSKNSTKNSSTVILNVNKKDDKEMMLSELMEEVEEFCHNRNILMETFRHTVKAFDADQPIEDLFNSVCTFLCQPHRSVVPFTPRLLILGPPGTPVEDAATELAEKYKFSLISFEDAKENEISKKSKLGQIFTLCQETCSQEPDEAMFDLINQELNNIEHHSRGWVVIGFPNNIDQTKCFAASGHEPNRVFFLDMMDEQIMDKYRLSLNAVSEGEKLDKNFSKKSTFSKDELCFKLTKYRLKEAELKQFYKEEGFEVDANMSLDNIIQTMEGIIVNPLPTCSTET